MSIYNWVALHLSRNKQVVHKINTPDTVKEMIESPKEHFKKVVEFLLEQIHSWEKYIWIDVDEQWYINPFLLHKEVDEGAYLDDSKLLH